MLPAWRQECYYFYTSWSSKAGFPSRLVLLWLFPNGQTLIKFGQHNKASVSTVIDKYFRAAHNCGQTGTNGKVLEFRWGVN